ncbi:hypothetical protein BDV12DRAFT_203894 [Aspergillus spectabilis]
MGLDVHAGKNVGYLVYRAAAAKEDPDGMLDFLLQNACSIDDTDDIDRTALFIAANVGAEDAMLRLLERGAYPLIGGSGETALSLAARNGYVAGVRATVQVLDERKLDLGEREVGNVLQQAEERVLNDSDAALESMCSHIKNSRTTVLGPERMKQFILALLCRPLFERFWEAAAARNVVLMCGPTQVERPAFCHALSSPRFKLTLQESSPTLQSLIIRPHWDYFSAIMITAPGSLRPEWPVSNFSHVFVLAWDWESSQSGEDYQKLMKRRVPEHYDSDIGSYLAYVTRLWNVSLVIEAAEEYDSVEERILEALWLCETAFGAKDPSTARSIINTRVQRKKIQSQVARNISQRPLNLGKYRFSDRCYRSE